MLRPRHVLPLALVAGCIELSEPPGARHPLPPDAAEAAYTTTFALEGTLRLFAGAPAELRPGAPTLSEVTLALASSALREAVAVELDLPAQHKAFTIEAHPDERVARLVVRGPDEALTRAACRAAAKIAETRIDAAAGGAVESWLTAEIARVEREIGALDRELTLLSLASPSPVAPRSRQEALVAARIHKLEAEASSRGEMSASRSPILAGLARALAESERDRAVDLAAGHGPAHPAVRQLEARAEWLKTRIAAQRALDLLGASEVEHDMTALPTSADAAAVARVVASRVRRTDLAHVSFVDPVPLQLLAFSAMLLAVDEAEGAEGRGPAHPARVAMRARLEALHGSFRRERDALANAIEARLPGIDQDPRPALAREDALRLTALLARLTSWRETTHTARWRPELPCARLANP